MSSPPSRPLVIAVDGPSGSGKSTVARRVASRLCLRYLDTGAMYRGLTWAVLAAGVAPEDEAAVCAVAGRVELDLATDPARPGITVDGMDVSGPIRGPEVTAAVSAVSSVPEVRRRLVALQRALIAAAPEGIVVEGRDIGSTVAPEAEVKIFLTADPEARAARRARELAEPADASAVQADLARRDTHDSRRAVSPLTRAPDAVEIDSTALGIDEVVAAVLALVPAETRRAAR